MEGIASVKTCSVEDCERKHYGRGMCRPHYDHARWRGQMEPLKRTLNDRFWAKVDKSGECWIWTGGRNDHGYGSIKIDHSSVYVHRVSFEMANGPIPPGMVIDHICHTHACVRPSHLRLATQKQNMENHSGLLRNNTSGARGVSWHKRAKKWMAQVKHDGVNYYLGMFPTMEDADAAVLAKRLEFFTHNNLDRVRDAA